MSMNFDVWFCKTFKCPKPFDSDIMELYEIMKNVQCGRDENPMAQIHKQYDMRIEKSYQGAKDICSKLNWVDNAIGSLNAYCTECWACRVIPINLEYSIGNICKYIFDILRTQTVSSVDLNKALEHIRDNGDNLIYVLRFLTGLLLSSSPRYATDYLPTGLRFIFNTYILRAGITVLPVEGYKYIPYQGNSLSEHFFHISLYGAAFWKEGASQRFFDSQGNSACINEAKYSRYHGEEFLDCAATWTIERFRTEACKVCNVPRIEDYIYQTNWEFPSQRSDTTWLLTLHNILAYQRTQVKSDIDDIDNLKDLITTTLALREVAGKLK